MYVIIFSIDKNYEVCWELKMGVGYEDSGTGFKITSSGFITHSAPLEHT